MKSERDQEVVDNLPLVTFILKKYFHNITEDMFQIGCIGLIKGVNTYNANKKTTRSTYYATCIYNEIANDLRHLKCKSHGAGIKEISLYGYVYENITLEDTIEDENVNVEEDVINNELLKNLYNLLDDTEKYIIKYSFGLFGVERKTQNEIAKDLHSTQTTISKKIKKILEKMRENGEML